MSRCRIALRPCSTAISWEACRSAHRLPAGERLDAPQGPRSQGALESGPETVKWTRLADQRGLLDARAICSQTSPPPSGADSVGTGGQVTRGAISTCSCQRSQPSSRRRFPRLPQIMGSQSSCQFKSPHHRPPLIVQCVPAWQWIASWGKRRTPRGPLLSAIRLTLSRPGGRWLPGCRRHIDPMSNEIWNVGVRFCDLSRLDIGDRDAQLQPLRRASLWSFVS